MPSQGQACEMNIQKARLFLYAPDSSHIGGRQDYKLISSNSGCEIAFKMNSGVESVFEYGDSSPKLWIH